VAEVVVADAEGICPLAAEGPDVKRLSTLCLVALVALAGCTGGGGGGTPTDTTTQTPIEGTAPPGVSASGVDADALVSAHLEALANRSYTMTVERSGDGADLSVTTRAEAGHVPALVDVDGGRATQEVYVSSEGGYELRQAAGEQIVRRTQENASTVPTGERYIRQVLADGNVSYTGTVERNGQTYHRLRAGLPDLDRQIEDGRATWFEVQVLVDDSGLVHSISYRLTVEQNGTESDLRIEMDLSDIGTTAVAEPAWLGSVGDDQNTTTRVLSSSSLGTSVTVSGDVENVTAVTVSNATSAFYESSVVEPARTTPIVAMQTNRSITFESVSMEYDLGAVPDAEANGLFVFVYHPSYGSLLPMETSFDPTNETVRATQIDRNVTLNTTDGGQITPTLDGLRGNFVFVTMDAQTYRDALEEQASGQQAREQSD